MAHLNWHIKKTTYWVFCFHPFFNVMYFISYFVTYMFYIVELLFKRKSTLENPFAQTFQISTLCICTGPHESLFYFSCLLYYCCCFHLSIFASFDKEIRRGTSLLFCTEYVRNIHLLCSEQTLKKWNLHQTSEHSTEMSLLSLMVDRHGVESNVSSTRQTCPCQSMNAFKKNKNPLDTFLCFTVSFLFFVVEKKIVFTCGFSKYI